MSRKRWNKKKKKKSELILSQTSINALVSLKWPQGNYIFRQLINVHGQHGKISVANNFECETPVESCDSTSNRTDFKALCCQKSVVLFLPPTLVHGYVVLLLLLWCSWTLLFGSSTQQEILPCVISGRVSELHWLSGDTFPLRNRRVLWSKHCAPSLVLSQV